MVKKIKKCSKFIVCMLFILGLMAPSYAALSASDGSAFVTKAEFDSALADFNSRLTTFEAGINSKIDSQVTSYLDRNGIWSGKEQVLVTPLALCGITHNGSSTTNKSGITWYTSLESYKGGDGEVVFKSSKSGLAHLETEVHLNDARYISNEANFYDEFLTITGSQFVRLYNTTANMSNQLIIKIRIVRDFDNREMMANVKELLWTSYGADMRIYGISDNGIPWIKQEYFFVDKDVTYLWSLDSKMIDWSLYLDKDYKIYVAGVYIRKCEVF